MIVAYLTDLPDGRVDYFSFDRLAEIACRHCGTILDDSFVPKKLAPKRRYDAWATYEGRSIFGPRFVKWAMAHAPTGISFAPIGDDGKWFRMTRARVVEVDTEKSETELSPICAHCGRRTGAHQKKPIVLRNVTAPLPPGLYWTDILYGGGREQTPALLLSPDAKRSIEQFGIKSLLFEPVYSSDHKFPPRPPNPR